MITWTQKRVLDILYMSKQSEVVLQPTRQTDTAAHCNRGIHILHRK